MSWYSYFSRTPKNQIDWEAIRTQSAELENNSDLDRRVAHVPKITPVKEGQQYPVGKHGQLKLFHEHVWPNGFTPQRLNEVSEATRGFVTDEVGNAHSGHLQNKIVETMARSTVPVDTLRALADNGSIAVSYETGAGEFDAEDTSIRISPSVLGKYTDFDRDGSGTVASQITMHELGHMNDYLSDYDDFYKNDEKRAHYKGDFPSPALEGRAEGFRLATTRITRGMRRGNESRLGPTAKYEGSNFDAPSRAVFNLNRLKSFRHASGLDALPRITETPHAEEHHEETPLPGMEKYL